METAKVRLRKPTRVFTFLCRDVPLERDEPCIVRSDRGLEFGTCVVPPEPCPEEMAKRLTMQVVRRANTHDEMTYKQLLVEEEKALQLCKRKVAERHLPMKLVDAEYTFDKRRVIFYFTADDRVDFRELVRDLAHELKTRIELRHIQVRDEAKMVGGIGSCGLELCCRAWLSGFVPISMKMAKRQSLSLNPAKISGQCGRLMCCLSYENDQYPSRKRGASKAATQEKPPSDEDAKAAPDGDAAAEDIGPSADESSEFAAVTGAVDTENGGPREPKCTEVASPPAEAAASSTEETQAESAAKAEGGAPPSVDASATEKSGEEGTPRRKHRRRKRKKKHPHNRPHK